MFPSLASSKRIKSQEEEEEEEEEEKCDINDHERPGEDLTHEASRGNQRGRAYRSPWLYSRVVCYRCVVLCG